MSKKKNTLKDLDEFLKQQASLLVAPAQLGETIPGKSSVEKVPDTLVQPNVEISMSKILSDLQTLAKKDDPAFRKQLYDLIIKCLEVQKNSSAEDKMLINTALYLSSGSNWKNAIREYWKK